MKKNTKNQIADSSTPRGKRKGPQVPPKFSKNFLAKLDNRFALAKELRATYDSILSDLGGEDQLSTIKKTLVEKFCWLSALMRGVEQKLAETQGDKEEAARLISVWVQSLNSLVGLGRSLGLDRKDRKADLRSYIDGVGR